jgi:hypothetical protein
MWHVRAEDVPEDRDEQIDWLFGCWCTLDSWVDRQQPEVPVRS